MSAIGKTVYDLVGCQTSVVFFKVAEHKLSLFGFVSAFQKNYSFGCCRAVSCPFSGGNGVLKMKLGFKFEVYFIILQ